VGRIYAEAKGRPLYIVARAVGFEEARAQGESTVQMVARVTDPAARQYRIRS
jgi:hypothetical protein